MLDTCSSCCVLPLCWCRSVGSAGAGLNCSCCAPQVLQFGLYEFIREEGNPGGVRKMKKGTEVWNKIVFSRFVRYDAPSQASCLSSWTHGRHCPLTLRPAVSECLPQRLVPRSLAFSLSRAPHASACFSPGCELCPAPGLIRLFFCPLLRRR
jgi:hypothetical protein